MKNGFSNLRGSRLLRRRHAENQIHLLGAMVFIVLSFNVFGNATPFARGVTSSDNPPKFIDEYVVPTPNAAPLAITVDRQGIVWFTESNVSKLGRFDPVANAYREYDVPGVGDMWGLTVDKNGYVWLTQSSGKGNVNPGGAFAPGGPGRLVRFDPQNDTFLVVEIPTNGSFPMRLVVDAQNRIWFTEFFGNKIGVYDQSSKKLIEYSIPTNSSGPSDLTFDEHGTLWVMETYAKQMAAFFPTNGSFVQYPVTPASSSQYVASPVGLAVDKTGNVWFADHGGNWIGKFSPSSLQLVLYPTQTPRQDQYPTSIPNDIAIDAKGRIWFTEHGGNNIAYLDPASQVMVEYPIPTGPISTALWLTLAPNGYVWFTEYQTSRIGVVHSDRPVPVSLNAKPSIVSLQQGSQISVSLEINSSQTVASGGTFRYSWASYDPNEITVAFTPACSLPTNPGNVMCQAALTLSKPVNSGDYMLGLGIDLGSILVWTMIQVRIAEGQPTQSIVPQNQLVSVVAATAAFGLTVLALIRRRRRKQR